MVNLPPRSATKAVRFEIGGTANMNANENPSSKDIFINIWLGLGLSFWVGMGIFVFWCLLR